MKEKCFKFRFNGSIGGYGFVYANSKEEAIEKAENDEYDDILDTWDMTVDTVTDIEEVED